MLLVDNLGRNTNNRTIVRDIMYNHSPCTNFDIIPYPDVAQNYSPRPDITILSNDRTSVGIVHFADSDRMLYYCSPAYYAFAIDDNAETMVTKVNTCQIQFGRYIKTIYNTSNPPLYLPD